MKPIRGVLAILPLAGLCALGSGCAHHSYATYDDQTPYQYQETRPYEAPPPPPESYRYQRGGRRESLRSLADELDQNLQVLAQSSLAYGRRGRDERKLRDGVEELMKKNARFQERLGRRERSDLREDVEDMRDVARKIGDRMRDARVSRDTYSAYSRVEEVLARMDQTVAERRDRRRDRDDD
jgi:hypothetical protein